MRKVHSLVLALFFTLLAVGGMLNQFSISSDNPAFIAAQTVEETAIPTEIQGVWDYDEGGNRQSISLRGNQMTITDDFNGTVFYTVDLILVEPTFNREGIEDTPDTSQYTLKTDLNDYVMRYTDDPAYATTDTFYFVYDAKQDILMSQAGVHFQRNHDKEQVQIIKDNLTRSQPINLEMLLSVEESFLLEHYQTLMEESDQDIWVRLYRAIADNHPDLGLLRNQDYEAYQAISGPLIEIGQMTYSRLGQANPAFVLNLYRNLIQESDDSKQVFEDMLMEIESQIQDYHNRRLDYENSLRTIYP